MSVPAWVWGLTIAGIAALLLFDFLVHVRRAHTPTLREAALWSAVYVSVAILFGAGLWLTAGSAPGLEYFAGYVTEKALSVDNLFVFLIIMTSFRVPRADQQKVLLFGIVVSLAVRGGFIALGAALINTFSAVFYLFGLILLLTAGNLIKDTGEAEREVDNLVIRLARRMLHTTDRYDGDRLFTVVDGARVMTPMLLVMIAIGGTDILFALDSIPAIFGLTSSAYIVFTATAFSLMGLRQLYFLIDGLLDRLIYLSYGLAVILGFIGVKLILHALHENNLPIINGGGPVTVVEISTELSLAVVVGSLLVTVLGSVFSAKGRARTIINNAQRHANQYLDLDFETDPAIRERNYLRLLTEKAQLGTIPAKYRSMIRDEPGLAELLARAQATHDAYIEANPQLAAHAAAVIEAHQATLP